MTNAGAGSIRRAVPADLEAVLALRAAFARIDGHPHDELACRRALAPLLAGDEVGQVWLIVRDDPPHRVVAYASVTWSWSIESGGRDCILDELYVEDRGQGLGGRLLETAMREAEAAGAAAIFLETERHNDGARRFYAAHGFEVEDSIWMQRGLGGLPRPR